MSPFTPRELSTILQTHQTDILADWLVRQSEAGAPQPGGEQRQVSAQFLRLVTDALKDGAGDRVDAPAWTDVRELLEDLSRARAREGYTPAQTATFVFSLKRPLFDRLQREVNGDRLSGAVWLTTQVLDALGLYTVELHQKGREEVIARQQTELLELSTPVVQLWDGVLALPLIGTLDSNRTQVVMENLLNRIVETGSRTAIIDITGVPTVDTLVAQHLLKTVAAARLMGADCIISGIRPQIAQTIVHLGVELGTVITKATLADAFKVALGRHHLVVAPSGAA
ncbi:MAG TPA: STAS domain-containing protein [Vicinamibacterales bacterium]